jgi:hypothetical protein
VGWRTLEQRPGGRVLKRQATSSRAIHRRLPPKFHISGGKCGLVEFFFVIFFVIAPFWDSVGMAFRFSPVNKPFFQKVTKI